MGMKLHICGNITHLLPALAKPPTGILDLVRMVDMAAARKVVGPMMIFCGNPDPVAVVQNESPDVIEQKCRATSHDSVGRV